MLQFNIGGKALDLGGDVSLSLTKKNNAFTFGDLELTRSVSFKIPATAKNDTIFSLAKDYHLSGSQARAKLTAQLQYDGGVANGYLYISQCSAKEYECVFTFGDLTPLKAISDNGKIKDHYILTATDVLGVPMNAIHSANDNNSTFAVVAYHHPDGGDEHHNPSIRLKDLLKDMYAVYGVDFSGVTNDDKIRVILDKINDVSERQVTIKNDNIGDNSYVPSFPGNLYFFKSYGGVVTLINKSFNDSDGTISIWKYAGVQLDTYNKLDITFPADFPDNIFLVSFRAEDTYAIGPKFYGNYSFDTSYSYMPKVPESRVNTGLPLAGKTVSLDKYDDNNNIINYQFVNKNAFWNGSVEGGLFDRCGFMPNNAIFTTDFNVKITAKVDYNSVNRAYLKDNIPDYTYLDVIKMFSNIFGKYITYGVDAVTSHPTIYLKDLYLSNWSLYYLKDVTKTEQVKRVFKDWKRNNYVRFDSEEYIETPLTADYTISNASLEEKNDLYKFPVSEGIKHFDGSNYNVVVLEDFTKEDNGTFKVSAKKKSVSVERLGGYRLGYIQQTNSYFQREYYTQLLCSTSTQIKVTAIMSLLEYNTLKENCLIVYDGVKWVWTEAQWSNGKVTLTLQKYA